ncbi:MAG: hypothetical protein ACJZ12_00025 [Candidatus Neomarinimicrobiota bacterium]
MIKKFIIVLVTIFLNAYPYAQGNIFELQGQSVLSFSDGKSNDVVIEECRDLAMVNMFQTLAMLPIEMIDLDCAFSNITNLQFVEENVTDKKVMVRVEAKIESQLLFGECMNSN